MKIAVIGATGRAGSLIVKEAVARGHDVTAIVREGVKVTEPKAAVLSKDLFTLTYDDVKDYDVIIDAFGAWTPETVEQHQTSLKYLADMLGGKPNRLLVVGGAASLYVDRGHTTRLIDTPDFPDIYKPVASNMAKAFDALRTRGDVKWTYLSPSANFEPEGPRTGKYTAGGDELMVNSKGESQISFSDYAIAMVDEAENGKHINARFTVVSE